MSYDWIREFAASAGLVFLMASFVVVVGWAFRPGAGPLNRAAKLSIFNEDDHG